MKFGATCDATIPGVMSNTTSQIRTWTQLPHWREKLYGRILSSGIFATCIGVPMGGIATAATTVGRMAAETPVGHDATFMQSLHRHVSSPLPIPVGIISGALVALLLGRRATKDYKGTENCCLILELDGILSQLNRIRVPDLANPALLARIYSSP